MPARKPIDADFLAKHEPLILTIDARGRLYINFGQNQDQPVAEATVSSRTAALLRRDPQTPVLVKADTTVPYGTVVRAMVLLQKAGASKVGFLTDPPCRAARRAEPPAGALNAGLSARTFLARRRSPWCCTGCWRPRCVVAT